MLQLHHGWNASNKILSIIKKITFQNGFKYSLLEYYNNNNNTKKNFKLIKNKLLDIRWMDGLINFMIYLISNKICFSDDTLNLCWFYIYYKYKGNDEQCFKHKLWETLINECKDVIINMVTIQQTFENKKLIEMENNDCWKKLLNYGKDFNNNNNDNNNNNNNDNNNNNNTYIKNSTKFNTKWYCIHISNNNNNNGNHTKTNTNTTINT